MTQKTKATRERGISLDGATNFRDFGGYVGAGGARVRWGQLFRSGELSRLSDRDRDTIRSLGLDRILDLRDGEELERAPNALPEREHARMTNLALYPGSAQGYRERLTSGTASASEMREMMTAINRDLARNHHADYAALLREVAHAEGPVLIHCAAGKDRTGFGVAMLLFALGVSRDDVMEDYLLSERYFDGEWALGEQLRRYADKGAPPIAPEVLRPVVAAHPSYLGAALEEIRALVGSVDAYLHGPLECGPERREQLRARLLE